MDDYSIEDLKQLLNVDSDYEYLKLSVEKLNILQNIISDVESVVVNEAFKEILTNFLSSIEKEKNQFLIHIATCTDKKEGDFEFPNLLKFIKGSDDKQLCENFVKFFDFYVRISNVMFDVYSNIENHNKHIANILRNTVASEMSDKIKNVTIDTKNEEPKLEEAKAEEVKVEEVKTEEPKVEEVKVEEVKVEEVKVEEVKVEEVKVEEVKVEEVKVEEVKVEEPKVEEVKAEEVKVEEPKVEEVKAEEVKVEEPKVEEVKAEEVKVEEPKVEEEQNVKLEVVAEDLENKNENINNMEYSPDTVKAVRAELEENMKKIGDSCQKLEELEKNKNEISECKKSLEDFKSKGMNVDSALAPLDAQYNEVVGKLNGFATSLNDVNKNLKTLLESMN